MDPTDYENIVEYKVKGEYPPKFTKTEKLLLRRKSHLYDIEGRELFYCRYKGTQKAIKTKVVCGANGANEIFRDFHASATGAHCGQTKTRDAVSKRFYWPGMSVDINKWVSQCSACQASSTSIKKPTEFIPIKVYQPFELVGMDLIGKLTETKSGHQYICVMIDYYTKWPQAYPLTSKTAKEVAHCIMKFVHQFESPKRILTDQGKEFVNAINSKVCGILHIKRSLCSPYHPQTNGLVEKMNGTIQRALGKVVGEHPDTWDDYLDAVMFGLRTKKQMTTKYSPYFLMFGREARYPSQVPEHYMVDNSVEDIVGQEDLSQDIKQQQDLLELVRDNLDKGHDKTRGKVRQKDKTYNFKVGDKVWRQNIRSQQRKGGKLENNFLGPYTIVSIADKSVDLQNDKGTVFNKINMDQLKLSIDDTPRVPHRMTQKTAPPAAAPPATAPAATVPPPTAPPAAAPPAAAPPATAPAATVPPPTAPPAAAPPATVPPPTAPPAAAPPATVPPPTAPPAAAPPATVPPPTVPPATAPSPATVPPPTAPPAAAPPATVPPPTAPPAAAPPATVPPPTAPPAAAPPATVPPPTVPPATAPSPATVPPPAAPAAAAPPAAAPPATAPSAVPPATAETPTYTQALAEKYVKDAWAGNEAHVLLSKIGAYKLYYWDINRIGPGMELESEVINAYLAVIVRQHNRQNPAKATFIDSFAMTALWQKRTQRIKIKPMEYGIILGIVNDHHHWTLVVIYPQQKQSLYLDSLGESKEAIQRCLDTTRAFMRKKGCNFSRWTCGTVGHTKQSDSTSCGVFALKFAECLLKGENTSFPATKEVLNRHRQEIAITLLMETDDLTDRCHFCGETEHETDVNWIQCDVCLRWFHQICVQAPPADEEFICPAELT